MAEEESAEAAVARYTRLIEREPDSPSYHYWRGQAYAELYEAEAAESDFTTAIRLKPDVAEYYAARGDLNRWADSSGAAEDYLMAIQLDPSEVSYHLALGQVYEVLDEDQAALENYNVAIDRLPRFIEAYELRASLNLRLGNHDAAIEDYTFLVEQEPVAYRYATRARAEAQGGAYDQAIADFSEAHRLDPESNYYLTERAATHLLNRDTEAALADLTTAIDANSSWGPFLQRGEVLWDLGRHEEALTDFDSAAELGDLSGYYRRGQALADLGRSTEAIADFDYLVAEGLGDYGYDYLAYEYYILLEDVLYQRAVLRADTGDLDGAAEDLEMMVVQAQTAGRIARPGVVQSQTDRWIADLRSGTNPFAD